MLPIHSDGYLSLEESLYDGDLPVSAWIIVTYDLLTTRAESFVPPDEACATWLRQYLTDHGYELANDEPPSKTDKLPPLRLDPRDHPGIGNALLNLAAPESGCITQKTLDKLRRIGRRLAADLSAKILAWDPDLVCVDEAHRIKNSGSGRTRAVRVLIEDKSRGALLMTGTPLRNHEGEGANLVEAIAPGVKARLAQAYAAGYWRSARNEAAEKAVGELLKSVMIRRLKADVLDLPPKLRQWIEIEPLGLSLEQYLEVMDQASDELTDAIQSGETQAEATKKVMGLLAKARRLLGMAKIANPAVADLIDEIVDERGACLVFTSHHDVMDGLAAQLRDLGRSVTTVDGRTTQEDRASAAAQFQSGQAEIFLGSINAAGEALTLTRADTCVFVELDWVPAAMHQAEDRGHRPGQTAAGYHIITIAANLSGLNIDGYVRTVLTKKLVTINAVLNESAGIIGDHIDTDDGPVLARIISAMLSSEQKALANTNAANKAAAKAAQKKASAGSIERR